ncbi:Lrp/AsnC family transcriptional regulator [Candidatus Woesearchaeota archaeon]|jgi:DNA-binding Lrp family transcriptional regulator|nr:Lrp/AsnC family transcriptional regulator [Candidatus Woesearchaeota archaeon]MBT4110812.1 Lrp/AsnC family transcriptional regulator [Candidatus Woesearchaeota archaeon]MBT4336676.1 Lrp/AsnC family transcriptional regulator [Candidatus Woesearchaeota archaeon]MBT4469575.1 Lrp/AsnC family transcriptional regulator [Candidatus Woesearchaeota archaeon]MBT6743937.1 Lrp/AsnC family transcriptional regulator [Candidatus Woesearchaeota archaeon]
MNPKTLQLLMHLRENSREKLTSISKKTNIPISTLFDLLKELQGGLILKSTVLLDYSKLGYHARAKVFLKVSNENKEKLKNHLNLNPNVNTIYKINNGWSFLIETVHKNIKELDIFLEKLEDNYNIENKQIHYLIDEVKREGFVVD